jgi:hypothetical protein
MVDSSSEASVLRLTDLPRETLANLLARFGLELKVVQAGAEIPGSYWGESEAGLIERQLYARNDTPVHSLLHESCHFICMSVERRADLHTDAGGGFDEENAVCYLQILLADQVHGMGKDRMLADMDAWGYSFRLGSARKWFEHDADEPREKLIEWGLIDTKGQPSGKIRH